MKTNVKLSRGLPESVYIFVANILKLNHKQKSNTCCFALSLSFTISWQSFPTTLWALWLAISWFGALLVFFQLSRFLIGIWFTQLIQLVGLCKGCSSKLAGSLYGSVVLWSADRFSYHRLCFLKIALLYHHNGVIYSSMLFIEKH